MSRLPIHLARPFLTLALVLLGWLIIPAVVKRFTRASLYEIEAPLETSASVVRDLQEFWSLKTRSKNELIEVSRDLGRLNASYELRLQETMELQSEVSRLEDLLRLPPHPEYRSEPARVVQRDFTAWWQFLVIRKGKIQGIQIGAPVVYSRGLVGKVTEVNEYTSKVELISSPGVRLAATIDGDKRPISYQGGDNPPFSAPYGLLEFVPLDLFASKQSPIKLITSGLGGVYPRGLEIGQVIELEPGSDGLFKTGRVQLDPALSELTEVTVLVPIAKQH